MEILIKFFILIGLVVLFTKIVKDSIKQHNEKNTWKK